MISNQTNPMKSIHYFLIAGILLSSCVNYDTAEGTPECVSKKLKTFASCGDGEKSVYEYEYQDELVYLFDHGGTTENCPTGYPVFDATCDKIGTLWNDELEGEVNGDLWNTAVLIRKVFPADD